MKDEKDIQDDEIRIIGDSEVPQRPRRWETGWRITFGIITLLGAIIVWWIFPSRDSKIETETETYFDPQPDAIVPVNPKPQRLGLEVDSLVRGFTEIRDTTVNDIPLRIYIPHNAEMTLYVGQLDQRDTTIVYAAQAADIRRDNRKIVGAFVLKGEPLAWGLSKKGYCAIIDGRITIGVADNSPLFEEATECGGYFFRQYPLVDNGRLVENEPKNKSIRRAICDRNGEIVMVDCSSPESFHDFAQALVDLGVTNAIYLVGSTSYGWAVEGDGSRVEFGAENCRLPKNTSYVVWRKR